MEQEAVNAIISGLKGEFIHSDPLAILKDLTPATARKKTAGYDHSCWDLLYHTVLWNNVFLSNIKGKFANWNPSNNWPDIGEFTTDNSFYELMKNFESQLQEVRMLLQDQPLRFSKKQKLSETNDEELSVMKLYITILQHISYHIGQIACIRKIVEHSFKE